jgi:hypothetical protein
MRHRLQKPGKIIDSKIIFGTTDGQDLHGLMKKCRAVLGQAKLALCFQIPSQASLHGILKPHRLFCYANSPASRPRRWSLDARLSLKVGKIPVCAWFPSGAMNFEPRMGRICTD